MSSDVPALDEQELQARRLSSAAEEARAAEDRGDDAAAGDAWRRYRLIRDALRDPDDLLAEGLTLSDMAVRLLKQR